MPDSRRLDFFRTPPWLHMFPGGIPSSSRSIVAVNPPRDSSEYHERPGDLRFSSDSTVVIDPPRDVFISYHGLHMKADFVRNLSHALKLAGLNPRVNIPLEMIGNSFDPVARAHVAVVSEGYAESKDRLTELVAMMRSGKPVIPVFYDVAPAHLRPVENGVFAEAFEKHKLTDTRERVEEWTDALRKLADIAPFSLCDYEGDTELVRAVVYATLVRLEENRLEQIFPASSAQEVQQDHPDLLEQGHLEDMVQGHPEDLVENIVFLESILQTYYPTIKDIEIDEATQPAQDHFTTIVLGFHNAVTDNLEFYFENGESMAKIVGVGLQYGKATIGPEFFIKTEEIEKQEWKKIWSRVRTGLDTAITVLKVALPPEARTQVSEIRQHEDSSNLATSSSNDGVFQERASGVSNNRFQVPFLCELAKYFIVRKVVDAIYTQFDVQTFGESSKIHNTEEYPGGRSRTGGVREGRTINLCIKFLKELFSQSNQDKQGGNGGRGDGGGEGGGDNGQGNATTVLPKEKLITTKVSVTLLPGGDFFDEQGDVPRLDNLGRSRLNDVVIQPHLTLCFHKTTIAGGVVSKEIQGKVGIVQFCLSENCDGFESDKRFGWFHDELRVSFGPKSGDLTEVHLTEENKEENYAHGKTTNTESSSKETAISHERGVKVIAVLGNNHVGRVEVGGDITKGTHGFNSQSREQSMESPCKLTTGGFYIQPIPKPREARSAYCYTAPCSKVIPEDIEDSSYRKRLHVSPLCTLQETAFSCTWSVHGNADVLLYNFKAVRRLREIQSTEEGSECSSSSFGRMKRKKNKMEVTTRIWESPPVVQVYEKDMHINLAMTHLLDGDTFKLFQNSTGGISWLGNDPLLCIMESSF